jgi:hypothetical protein
MLDKKQSYNVISFKDRSKGEFLFQNNKYYRRNGTEVLKDEIFGKPVPSKDSLSFELTDSPEDLRKVNRTCEVCGKKIHSLIGFYSHMRAKHPEKYNEIREIEKWPKKLNKNTG